MVGSIGEYINVGPPLKKRLGNCLYFKAILSEVAGGVKVHCSPGSVFLKGD